MREHILLVDGHNLLFQMFYGMPSRISNRDGVGIWGVIGFIGALRKILLQVLPTHVCILFDGEHKNVRCDIDEEYKANRPDFSLMAEEDNPFTQLPLIKRALEYLQIPYAETTTCEVDDWMAGYVRAWGDNYRITISSFDSDFFQLIGDNVSILRYRGDASVICDTAYLRDKYNISPQQYADFKALVGDPADNINGVDKVGPKTAAKLLATYETLEGILSHAEEIPSPALRTSLLTQADKARRNYTIIRLTGDVPLPLVPSDMAHGIRPFTTNEVLCGIGLIP